MKRKNCDPSVEDMFKIKRLLWWRPDCPYDICYDGLPHATLETFDGENFQECMDLLQCLAQKTLKELQVGVFSVFKSKCAKESEITVPGLLHHHSRYRQPPGDEKVIMSFTIVISRLVKDGGVESKYCCQQFIARSRID